MKQINFRTPAILFFIAILLSACATGIIPEDSGNGNVVVLSSPAVTQVANSRASTTWTAVDGADGYQVNVDGAGFATIAPDPCSGGNCTFVVPGLLIDDTHQVEFRAIQGSNTASDPTAITIDTTLKAARFSPPIAGNENMNFGAVIVSGDLEGDGYLDLAVSGIYRTDLPTIGQVDIFKTGPNFIDANGNISVSKTIYGTLGTPHGSVLSFGKVTGNTLDDLLIGQYTDEVDDLGRIYVYTAATLNSGTTFDSNTQRDFVIGSDPGATFARAEFGRSLAVAELNGDSCDDVITGAPQWIDVPASPFYNEGKVYEIDGCITANVTADGTDEIYTGAVGQARAGRGAWNVGDINGDGVDDVLYISRQVDGPPASTTLAFVGSGDWRTFEDNADLGIKAFALGNIDGDPYNDFAVTFATLDALFNRGGYIYIFRGSASGPVATSIEIDNPLQRGFGMGVAFGDIDADGEGELVIGSETEISIYEGPDFEDGRDQTLAYGCESTIIMDANADGYLDLVCGDVAYNPDGGVAEGALLVLF